MKKATCKDLRGACDTVITGETAEGMGENCKAHVVEMMAQNDEAHQTAVQDMMNLSPEEQKAWYADFEKGFDSLEDA